MNAENFNRQHDRGKDFVRAASETESKKFKDLTPETLKKNAQLLVLLQSILIKD